MFRLKFATAAFIPALADPFAWIYEKALLDKDPHWFEKNVMGSGPFKFAEYETGQSIKGVRNPDYFIPGLPYLDGFVGIYADKQATRVEAIRADRAAMEFRGMPPAAVGRDQEGSRRQDHDRHQRLECRLVVHPQPQEKAVRRSPACAARSPWRSTGGTGRRRCRTSRSSRPSAPSPFPPRRWRRPRRNCRRSPGYWPDIEKSRAEAKRLLKEAGAEELTFELLNRNVDQPYKYVALMLIDDWSKIGLKVTQKVVPSGPWYEALRTGNFDVAVEAPGHGIVNPLLDVQKELGASSENYGGYQDAKADAIYDKMLHESDPAKQHALMFEFEKHNLDEEAHQPYVVWWYRIVPYHSYVKGWSVGPSHLANQDLATVWLDK